MKTAREIRAEGRLPTREEAAEAARILLLCNGHDLDTWSDGALPSDDATEALQTLSKA